MEKIIRENSIALKSALLIIISIFAGIRSEEFASAIAGIFEVIIVFSITNSIIKKNIIVSYIFNVFFSLIILLQSFVLLFSGEYTTKIMIENLGSYRALGNTLYLYIGAILLALMIAFIPIKAMSAFDSKKISTIIFLIAILHFFSNALIYEVTKNEYSPIASLITTGRGLITEYKNYNKYKNIDFSEIEKEYLRMNVDDGIKKPETLSEKPNVIVIFIEGMSAEIINNKYATFTPNLNEFYRTSLVFENYFNHTAATYRGLRGTLYSGYQYKGGSDERSTGLDQLEDDEIRAELSSNLVSLPTILNDNGYSTQFINTEPNNAAFSTFLGTLGFKDILVSSAVSRETSDKEAYALLYDAVIAHKSNQPFLISMYTLGTHHGFDSPDEKYKDGTDLVRNRFYNSDAQFGDFFNKFKESDLSKDTILVVTTDHASYLSPEYKAAVDSKQQSDFINQIPFMIYYNGVKHEVINVSGRNSIDFAPTILDLLDLEHHPNLMLGDSLFVTDSQNIYDKVSALGEGFFYTGNLIPEQIEENSKDYHDIIQGIRKYYSFTGNKNQK